MFLVQKQKIQLNFILKVARIVSNYKNYKQSLLDQGLASITFTSVFFPNPPEAAFKKKVFGAEGFPQVSFIFSFQKYHDFQFFKAFILIFKIGLSSIDSNTIVWNHPFMFTSNEEKDAMFSDGDAAIIVEFYPFTKSIIRVLK